MGPLRLYAKIKKSSYLPFSLVTISPEASVVVDAPGGVEVGGKKVNTRAPNSIATSFTSL